MKRILIIILLTALIVTACSTNDNNSQDNINKEDIIIEDQDQEEVKLDTNTETEVAELAIGLEAPDFTLTNLDGEEVSLSDFRGKIVLINFWATWCKYCDLEMPDLNNLHNDNEDVVVLAVNVQEDEDLVRAYIEKNQLDFEVVLDSDAAISRQYLTNGLPNSYFVDTEGVFLGRYPGMMTAEQMIDTINSIRELNE